MANVDEAKLKVSQELDELIMGFYKGNVTKDEIEIKRNELHEIIISCN